MYMFEVCAKCGHVGKGCYVEKIFAVNAESAKEAAAKVRLLPRVKHHHKDAIRYVNRIDELRYEELKKNNSLDPYFQSKNIQEQRRKCELEVFTEVCDDGYLSSKKEERYRPVYYGKQILRSPKKYINNYLDEQRYAV